MKWTVLSDNRTQNPSLQTEHGLSILLETDKHRILLDTGASDVFLISICRTTLEIISTTISVMSWFYMSMVCYPCFECLSDEM